MSISSIEFAGRTVPRLGLGTMALAIEGHPRTETAVGVIHAALDAGIRYIDTAWSYYTPGESEGCEESGERLVAQALRTWDGPRDDVVVATKTGYRRTLENGEYGWQADSRPETMIRNAKESCVALGVDHLDLLYSHCPDPAVPYEDEMGALRRLLDEGVIAHAGISRASVEQIDVAHAILGDGLAAVQNKFNPAYRDEEDTLRHCEALGIPFVAWSPLGGYLEQVSMTRFVPFRQVAADRGVSYQRVTLAWELAQSPVFIAIPSAQNAMELDDDVQALDLRLTDDEMQRLG
ncbi:MAG: aldo/keto reductase [Bifidobacteriaceae bacterium]|nr:aldo/keto reductase [Bifidobacteriaceae bacterium]